jgi:hypothetical protein
VQQPPDADPPAEHPPSRLALFLLGALGLIVALLAALIAAALLGDDGVARGFFIAAAVLTPVLGLGLLLQLIAALAGRTRGLLHQLKRFNEEMAAEPPELSEESQADRRVVWEESRSFTQVLGPFVAGLVLQLVVAEVVAVLCLAAGIDDPAPAAFVGVEVFALFNYFLFFNVVVLGLARRTGRQRSAERA